MMYYYWKTKGIRPSVFYQMPRGELTVVQAFYEQEIEERAEFLKHSDNKAFYPMWLYA